MHAIACRAKYLETSHGFDWFSCAAEADRDVWEQHNERFNNLTVLALLMLSVTVSLITEGSFDDLGDGSEFLFVLCTGLAMVALFLCLASSYRATRNMSQFMSAKSAQLSWRIHTALDGTGGQGDTLLSRGLSDIYRPTTSLPTRSELTDEILHDAEAFAAAYRTTCADREAVHPPEPSVTLPPRSDGPMSPASRATRRLAVGAQPMRFADFFDHNCLWLENLAVGSFASGVVLTTAAMGVLVHNEFRPGRNHRHWWHEPAYAFTAIISLGIAASVVVIFVLGRPESVVAARARRERSW